MDNQNTAKEGLEATTPGLTPPLEKNPENVLYREWQSSSSSGKPAILAKLLPHLRHHASKVCWMVLHSNQPDIIDEIANDALLDLDSFEGRSLFSTWFHARATFRCRDELRKIRRRRESSLTNAYSCAVKDSNILDQWLLFNSLLTSCSDFEKELVRLKIVEGLTDLEIARELGFTRQWIQICWQALRKELRQKHGAIGK